jgi:antitoxin (DNA-binding transcriptional repressor) of toxin-antitoxin stability system
MSLFERLSVTLLGPDIDHKNSLEAMLAGHVTQVTWLPESVSLQQGRPQSFTQRIQRAVDQLTHTRDKDFLDKTCRHLDEHGTNVIIAYWGTRPLADIVAIKRLRPHVKIVLMVLCFPLALENRGLRRQHWLMRHAAPYLDGVLYANDLMQQYFQSQVFGKKGRHLQQLILKPCWPLSYQDVEEPTTRASHRPNLIYVGRTDLSHHTVHAADDLRPLMAEILENQIELHHVRSPETTDGNPYRRPFEPLKQAGLIAKMASHDASLIAYNAAACQRTERLELTVPDRLLTSVAAGVPIAIPSHGYTGAKQYLVDYPAVLEFDSVPELKRQLSDRPRIEAMHHAALNARKMYTAEAQGPALADFLVTLTGATAAPSPLSSAARAAQPIQFD